MLQYPPLVIDYENIMHYVNCAIRIVIVAKPRNYSKIKIL